MPRLNIDDDVWPKFDVLAKRLNWRHQDAMSSVIYLWKKTQELQKLYCTLDEIALFARLRSKKKVHEFVKACVHPDVRLLTVCEQPIDSLLIGYAQPMNSLLTDCEQVVYRISGNKKHIDALKSYKERGKLGGRPSPEKPIGLASANPIQYNTIQYNSKSTANSEVSVSQNPFDLKIGNDWVEFAKTKLSGKSTLKINTKAYINAIRLMREQDGLSERKIQLLFDFIRKDEFWGKNGISPVRIRSRDSDGISKCDRILSRLNPRDFETEEERIERLKNDQIEFEKRMTEKSQHTKGFSR